MRVGRWARWFGGEKNEPLLGCFRLKIDGILDWSGAE
jgi:hypothetical protein